MSWYDQLFAGNTSPGDGITADDQSNLNKQGLLNAGLNILASNQQPGVTPLQAIAGGLLAGRQTAQQGRT